MKIRNVSQIAMAAVMLGGGAFAVPAYAETAAVDGAATTSDTVAAPVMQGSGDDADSWTGFYIGGNIGASAADDSLVSFTNFCGGIATFTLSASNVATVSPCFFAQSSVSLVNTAGQQTSKPTSFTGGLQAGYAFQSGNFVGGIEADFNLARRNETVSAGANFTNVTPQYAFRVTQSVETDWQSTLRARAGFTTGKLLVYGTGGLALTNLKYQMNYEDFPPTPPINAVQIKGSDSIRIDKTSLGWTVGGGAEYRVNKKWSINAGYLYTEFSENGASDGLSIATINSSGGVNGTTAVPNQIIASAIKLRSHSVRVGLNLRF